MQTAGAYVGFTESDLRDYPGLWLRRVHGEPALAGNFARYPLEEQMFGGEFRQSLVTRRADYLARTPGTRTFPWRVLMVSPDAAGLLGNDLVYRLASPLELQDVSWIRPGQSTEEWITSRLLYGVDFKSGLNTATYRYYIDFAAEYGVEYMMFDAGWSDADDNTKLNPAIDVPGLIAYANSKGVAVLLWNEARALMRNLEEALDRYAAWGARGIMVDFMDRDDQPMLRFQERLAREAAKRRLVVNMHGVAKPTGLQRAFPNLLTREAVLGHEYNMWSERVTPDHALTVPFVRMLAGPMDWEGGAMLNGTQKSFRVIGEQPMSQGTRTQQLAQFVIYDSPLQYLAGTPSDYRAEPEFTRFLSDIPTTWDETRPLQGCDRRLRRRGTPCGRHLVCRGDDRLDRAQDRAAPVVPAVGRIHRDYRGRRHECRSLRRRLQDRITHRRPTILTRHRARTRWRLRGATYAVRSKAGLLAVR